MAMSKKWIQFCVMWSFIGIMMQIDEGLSNGAMDCWNKLDVPNWRHTMHHCVDGVYRPVGDNYTCGACSEIASQEI